MSTLKYRLIIVIIVYSIILLQKFTESANNKLTLVQFNKAVFKTSGNTPNPQIYDYLRERTIKYTRVELAMFLAQMIYESDGFRNIEDLREHNTDYHEEGIGVANKSYHGRGYLMLTWAGNYQAASEDLWKNSSILLDDPDLLAKDIKIAVDVSVWYWETLVRPLIYAKSPCLNHFGYSTRVISYMRGSYECKPNDITGNQKADKRFQIYRIVSKEIEGPTLVYKKGCYDVED